MLFRHLATPAVLVAAALAARAGEVRPHDPTLEVQQGRAILVQRGSRGAVLYPGTERALRGECHLRVVAGGRAHVTWPGTGSLRIEGPTEIAWSDLELAGAALTDTRSLEWSLYDVGAVELELRRAGPRIVLPGGWMIEPAQGAYRFAGGAGERLSVTVRAGAPLALRFTDPAGRVRPPAVVHPGETVELSPALLPRSRPDQSAGARPWRLDQIVWPWGEKLLHWPRDERATLADTRIVPDVPHVEVEPHAPRAEPAPDAQRDELVQEQPLDEPVPDEVAPRTAIEASRTVPESAPALDAHGDADPPPITSPDAPAPEPDGNAPQVDLAPPPVPRAPAEPFDPLHWGGLERDRIRSLSFGALEQAPGLAWTQLNAGLWRIEHVVGAAEPAWLFTRREDVLLPAGTSATIDAEGRVLGFQGAVVIVPAPAARPRFDELEPPPATGEHPDDAGIRDGR